MEITSITQLDHIFQKYDAIGPMGPTTDIVIDQNFLGSTEIIKMFRSTLSTSSLSIKAQTELTVREENQLKLSGTASLLNMVNAPVTLFIQSVGNELLLTLEIGITPGWKFTDSFPDLPAEGTVTGLDGDILPRPNFMSELSLGTCKLIFSNRACYSAAHQCQLLPGLNFAGEIYFGGVLFDLGYLIRQEKPVMATGPIKEYRTTPDAMKFSGIRLSGDVDTDFKQLGPFTIRKTQLYIKSSLQDFQKDYVPSATQDPGIYLLIDIVVGGREAQLVGKYDLSGSSREFCVFGRFTDFEVAGFSHLSQTVGVDGFDNAVPAQMPDPGPLALTELGFSIDMISRKVSMLEVGVGTKLNWEIIDENLWLKEVDALFTLSDPFNKNRALSTTLTGLLAFKKFDLAAFAQYPDFRLGAGLPAGKTLPLGDVIESFISDPPSLPALTVNQLYFDGSPKDKTFKINSTIQDLLSVPVGETHFDVDEFLFALDYSPMGGAEGAFTAKMSLAETIAIISGDLGQTFTLSGSFQNFDLKKFWAEVTDGQTLPDEVPDIVFETMSVSVSPVTGDFSLMGNTTIEWDHLPCDGTLKTSVNFSFSRDVTKTAGSSSSLWTANLSMQGTGPAHVAEGLTLEAFNFIFDYRTHQGWDLSGGVHTDIFDKKLYLEAGYETSQLGTKLKLQTISTPETTLIDLDDVGEYRFKQFDLTVDERDAGEGKNEKFFNLRLASTIKINQVFEVGGYLNIYKTPEGADGLVFNPDKGDAEFDVNLPSADGAGMSVNLFEIGFIKESESAGWSFTGTTDIGFSGMPAVMGKLLPSKLHARLVAGKNNARISAVRITDPFEIPLPDINGKKLGNVTVQLTEVGVTIKPGIGMMLEAGIGLPAELNTFLGGSQVFRVYQKDNPLSLTRIRFTILGSGIEMQLMSSPFAGANSVMIKGESWVDIDFGEYGEISIKMPTFIYDGVTQYFEAGGGIKIKRTLSLPLKLVKNLLDSAGLEGASELFPDKIPVKGVNLVDENGQLKTGELVHFLEQAGSLPGPFVDIIEGTGNLIDRFPSDLKHYFNLEVPESLEFRFGFSATGRITVGLLASEEPVRVLYPSMVQSYAPMPGFVGMEIRKLNVGTIMSGSLFYSEVDAIMDQFDMFSLMISLMLPENKDFPLPTSDELHRRIILKNLFCIIPASEGLPIPIPVFYDQAGFEYLGVEGVKLQSHVSFPKPDLDAKSAMAFFKEMKEFTTDNSYLLDPSTAPEGLDLAFTFSNGYLQTPEYMGESLLGTEDTGVKISMWTCMAHLMNFGKTFSINELIGAIPEEYRVGSATQQFSFLKFDTDWLLTTPEEFRNGAFKQLDLTTGDRDDFKTVLPALYHSGAGQDTADEEGLVAFVRGEADLDFIRLNAAMGLGASGAMGFNTGIRMHGAIGDVIDLELNGAMMLNNMVPQCYTSSTTSQSAIAKESVFFNSLTHQETSLTLPGTGSWVEIPSSDTLELHAYTIEMWINPSKTQSDEWAFLFGMEDGNRNNFTLALNSKTGSFHHRFTGSSGDDSGIGGTSHGSVNWDSWQHVAITNDGETAKTFIFGQEAAKGAVSGDLVVLKQPVYMGKPAASEQGMCFNGNISEVRIWKRAKTGEEIHAEMRERLHGDEKDLVSLFHFDQNTGEKAIDICGRNTGTITNGTFAESAPVFIHGLRFNGKNNYIEINDSKSLQLDAYTVQAWVKPVQNGQEWYGVFGKKGRNYSIFIHRNGYVHHRFHDNTGYNGGAPNTPDNSIMWGEWNHIAITNDGKIASTYINGFLKASGPVSGKLVVDAQSIQIGRTADGTNNCFFNGEIGDIGVWNTSRCAGDIESSMQKLRLDDVRGLVSYWEPGKVKSPLLEDSYGYNPGTIHMSGIFDPEVIKNKSQLYENEEKALKDAHPENKNVSIKFQGHAHLDVAGHQAFSSNLTFSDNTFRFNGNLDLFPSQWPIRVSGHVNGMFSKERFYLSGETENSLLGLTLSDSKMYMANDQVRLEGSWLGLYALMNVTWTDNDPSITGSVGFDASPTLDFGSVRICGVRVADNVKISVDIHTGLDVTISRHGFSADVTATFKIHDTGFTLSFGIDTCPENQWEVVNWIRQKIINEPEKYLAYLFSDPLKWLKNIANGAIDFTKDVGKDVGKALDKGYHVAEHEVIGLMQNADYGVGVMADALGKGFGTGAEETAKRFKDAGYAADIIGNVLKDSFGKTAGEVAESLKGLGYTASDIGNVMKDSFGKSAEDVATALKNIGFGAADIGNAMKNSFGKGTRDVANTLKNIGFGAGDIGVALKQTFNLNANDAAKTLKNIGCEAKDIANALKGTFIDKYATEDAATVLKSAGFGAKTICDALKKTFTTDVGNLAFSLKMAGFGIKDFTDAFKNESPNDMAEMLLSGFNYKSVATVMREKFNWNGFDMANIMKNEGYVPETVASTMKNYFSSSAEDVANFMKNNWNQGKGAVKNILSDAGYAASEVNNVMDSVWDGLSHIPIHIPGL
ncbi:MAG: hypothetical protein GY737_20555 [Desulfobacteraceae bacterium]|nr:hypothetical protein [Desulfobacteraceae bacterium]